MATAHGNISYFSIEDSAGTTLRNITPHLKTAQFNWSQGENDVTTKDGLRAMKYRPGMRTATITLGGLWDDTASTGAQTVLASLFATEATVGFEWGPEGNAVGAVKYSGECMVSAYTEDSPQDDMVLFTATVRVSSTTTVGTFSA